MCLVAHLCPTLCNPMDYSPPSSSVHRDSPGKEYFSGLPCLPPGDLPNPRVEPKADSLCLQCGRPRFDSWVWKIPWRRDRLPTPIFLGFPYGSAVSLPAMWETWVWSLGWEGPLEKGMATDSSILAWTIPWTIQSMGSLRVGHNWATFTFTGWFWCFKFWEPWLTSLSPYSDHGRCRKCWASLFPFYREET